MNERSGMAGSQKSNALELSLAAKEERAVRVFLSDGLNVSAAHLLICIVLGLVLLGLAIATFDETDTEPGIAANVAGYSLVVSLVVLLSPLLALGGVVQIWPPMPLLVVLVVVNSLVCGFGVAGVLQLLRWIRARHAAG